MPLPPRSGSGAVGGSRPGSGGRRTKTTVLRENNWILDGEMPSSPELGSTGNVGAYMRTLAAEDSDELMRELNDALSEVRDLNAKNAELTTVGDARLAELDTCRKDVEGWRIKADEVQRTLALTNERLARAENNLAKGKDGGRSEPSSPVDDQETDQLRVRCKSLEAQLVQTEESWKALFESSAKDMEDVVGKVALLEGSLETGILEAERANSRVRVFEQENESLKQDVARHEQVHAEEKTKIAELFTDLANMTRDHEAFVARTNADKRKQLDVQASIENDLAAANQTIEVLRAEGTLQAESNETAFAAQKKLAAEVAALTDALAVRDDELTDSKRAHAIAMSNLETQAESLKGGAGDKGMLLAKLAETTKKLQIAEAGNTEALRLAEERAEELAQEIATLKLHMEDATVKTTENHATYDELSAETNQLARGLKESNDRNADLKHEVAYLLQQLAESKAKTVTAAEMPDPHTSKAMWEPAAVQLPGDDSRADAIVRMKVIEWGTIGADACCQTEGYFMDATDIQMREEADTQREYHRSLGMADLERKFRERGDMTEMQILEIVAYPYHEVGEYRALFKNVMDEEMKLRATGKYTEGELLELLAELSPERMLELQAIEKQEAATTIQSIFRGRKDRSAVEAIKPKPPKPQWKIDEENEAAQKIQAIHRGRMTRHELAPKFHDMVCQTDDVEIAVVLGNAMEAAGVSSKDLARAKRHLEKRLRETGRYSEHEIFRLLDYGAAVAAELEPRLEEEEQETTEALKQKLALLEALHPGEPEPEPEPEPLVHPGDLPTLYGTERLRTMLDEAGVTDDAKAEYLAKWDEDGIDDEVLEAWQGGVITSSALKEEFGVASVGDRYKILAALKTLPTGGVIPGREDDEKSAADASVVDASVAGAVAEVSEAFANNNVVVRPGTPPDPHATASVPAAERGDSPNMEQLGGMKQEFDTAKSKMAELLSSHFDDAIKERNQLLIDKQVLEDSIAELRTRFDFVQSNLAYAQEQTLSERNLLKGARADIVGLEKLRDEQSEKIAQLEYAQAQELKAAEQLARVNTEKLAAQTLEKEQYKMLVDKIGSEIVKEKADDKHLVEEWDRERDAWEKERESLNLKATELYTEITRLRKDLEALQTSLDMKENFAKRVEAEKENLVVSLRDLNHQLASKSEQVDELMADKENVTGELREHTEQYRDRLLEQMEQIKNLKELVEKKDALIETMRKEHYDAEEHARAVMEEKIEKVGELQERLDKVESEKEKVAKNCFEQMSKLNSKLEEVKELEAEKEAMKQRETQRQNELLAVQHDLDEFRNQAEHVENQLEEFKELVEDERQTTKEMRAENEVYSEQVKRLEMQVFEADMRRKDSSEKAKAKLRAVMSEKDNISSAYLKTTMRLAQAKESSMESQELAAEADAARAGLRDQVTEMEGQLNDMTQELVKQKKKMKKEKKDRFKAEEDMKEANRRAIEVEEVLAEKVRQLGQRILQSHGGQEDDD